MKAKLEFPNIYGYPRYSKINIMEQHNTGSDYHTGIQPSPTTTYVYKVPSSKALFQNLQKSENL